MTQPVSIMLREVTRGKHNPAHARVQVFIGRNPGARGNSGELVLRRDEWEELQEEFDVGSRCPRQWACRNSRSIGEAKECEQTHWRPREIGEPLELEVGDLA